MRQRHDRAARDHDRDQDVDPPPADDGERCTNQIDYAGDPRSNAEINSIGEATGQCPAPQTN